MDLSNFIYLKKKKFLFAYVPKVACTNWKCIFRYIEGYNDYLDSSLAHDRKNSGLTYLSNVSQATSILGYSEVSKYTFVRNPYSRVLSAYRNKVESFNDKNSGMHSQDFWLKVYNMIKSETAPVRKDTSVSFSDFLWWLENSKHPFAANEHWCSQSSILHPNEVEYDFIGKFETIDQDAKWLLNKIECDLDFPTQKQVNFPGTNSSVLIDKYYDKNLYSAVNKIYTDDFENFNYERK
jgi:hypothetical protein